MPGPSITSSIGPKLSTATDLIEYLTVSPIPSEVAIIIELSIRPITINKLCPFLLGIFLVPILNNTFLLIDPKNTTKNITTNKIAITVARLFAGIPKILSII